MNRIRLFSLSSLLFLSMQVSAAVVEAPDVSFGGKTYGAFQDDVTGLIWLDLDNFQDGVTTYNSLVSLLVGSGFHLATLPELEALQQSMPAIPANFAAEAVIVGGNHTSRNLMWGIYEDGNSSDWVSYVYRYGTDDAWQNGVTNAVDPSEILSLHNDTFNDLGAWIVEGEAHVAKPVPALNWQGIAVLLTLLAGMTYLLRRKFTA